MTFTELINDLPNGLHDALLRSFEVDYETGKLTLFVDIWMGDLDSDDEDIREERRDAKVIIDGFSNFIVEAPRELSSVQGPSMIDADLFPNEKVGPVDKIFRHTFPGEQQFWIFMNETNNFMFLSAKNVNLEWAD